MGQQTEKMEVEQQEAEIAEEGEEEGGQPSATRSPTAHQLPKQEGRSVMSDCEAPVRYSNPQLSKCLSCNTISVISLRRMKKGKPFDPHDFLQVPIQNTPPHKQFFQPLKNYQLIGLLAHKNKRKKPKNLVHTPGTRHIHQ